MTRIKYLQALTEAVQSGRVFPVIKTSENTPPPNYSESYYYRNRSVGIGISGENDPDRYSINAPLTGNYNTHIASIFSA